MGVLAGGCELGKLHKYQCRTSVRIIGAHLELGAPAGGIRLPIARARAEPTRAAQGKRAHGATRSRAQGRACATRAWRDWRGRDLARSEHVGTLTLTMGAAAARHLASCKRGRGST